MRIFKSFYLVPEQVYLLLAVGLNFVKLWQIINAFALFKYRNKQLPCREIGEGFCFPHSVRVKYCAGLIFIYCFIINAKLVGNCLLALVVVIAVNLLK